MNCLLGIGYLNKPCTIAMLSSLGGEQKKSARRNADSF